MCICGVYTCACIWVAIYPLIFRTSVHLHVQSKLCFNQSRTLTGRRSVGSNVTQCVQSSHGQHTVGLKECGLPKVHHNIIYYGDVDRKIILQLLNKTISVKSMIRKHSMHSSLVPRPLPAFKRAALKAGSSLGTRLVLSTYTCKSRNGK